MTDSDDAATAEPDLSIRKPPRILVPVAVLEGETIPDPLVDFLAPSEVVVLGYHVLPEQTPTEQASLQYEERAMEAVDDIAAAFTRVGGAVETRVAFTHDRDKTLERVAAEEGATAVLLPNPTAHVEEILVPLRGAIDVDRLADLVATLVGDARVTLWAIPPADSDVTAQDLLDDAVTTLRDRGLPDAQLRTESATVEWPTRAVVDRSADFDVIVMGEGERTLLTTVLGETTERIAEGAVAPVLVVRGREREGE
ncbi:MAG: universal stress protein [Haloplanus sp.]